MSMEIRPISGQPGLFRSGLSGTRWTSTVGAPMFRAPFGGRTRRRGGFGAIALPPEFITASRPEHLTQEDIPAGQVPGLVMTLFVLTPGPILSQMALDAAFRPLLGQLGFDVGASTLDATQLVFSWVKAADGSFEAKIAQGPAELIGMGGFKVVYEPPTPKDLQGLPVSIEKYTLLARPKDGILGADRVNKVLEATRAVRTALVQPLPNVGTELFLAVKGVPPPKGFLTAGFGGILGLLAVAGGAYALYREKTKGKLKSFAAGA